MPRTEAQSGWSTVPVQPLLGLHLRLQKLRSAFCMLHMKLLTMRRFPVVRDIEKTHFCKLPRVPLVEAGVPCGCCFSVPFVFPGAQGKVHVPQLGIQSHSGLSASLRPDQCLTHIEVIQNSYVASFVSEHTMTSPQQAREYARNQTDPHGPCILPLCLYVALSHADHLLPLDPMIDICSSFMGRCPHGWELPGPFVELCALSTCTRLSQSWPQGIFAD